MIPNPRCLFCLKAGILAKASEVEWDIKIKHIAEPFFTTFSLSYWKHWKSFKNSEFCSACFGRLEELQFLLRKIEVISSDVTRLKTEIRATVSVSDNVQTCEEMLGKQHYLLSGFHSLRQQLGADYKKSPAAGTGAVEHVSSETGKLRSACCVQSKFVPVRTGINCAEALDRNRTPGPSKGPKRRSSVSPHTLTGVNSKHPRLTNGIEMQSSPELFNPDSNSKDNDIVSNRPVHIGEVNSYEQSGLVINMEGSTSKQPTNEISSDKSQSQHECEDEGDSISATYTVHKANDSAEGSSNKQTNSTGRSDQSPAPSDKHYTESISEINLFKTQVTGSSSNTRGSKSDGSLSSVVEIEVLASQEEQSNAEGVNQSEHNITSESILSSSSIAILVNVSTDRDQVELPSRLPNSDIDLEILEILKPKAKRKRRPRRRLYDPPASMFLCVSKGCKSLFKSEDRLNLHIENDHNGEFLQNDCKLCLLKQTGEPPLASSTADPIVQLMCHTTPGPEKSHKCEVCPETFLTIHCKEYHLSRHRPLGGTTFTKCSECDKTFEQPACLRNHLKLHVLKMNCSQCSETFPSLLNLHIHNEVVHDAYNNVEKRNHPKKKLEQIPQPVQCPICDKKLSSKGELRRHSTSHVLDVTDDDSKAFPFECSDCHKKFAMEKYAKYHRISCKKRKVKKWMANVINQVNECA